MQDIKDCWVKKQRYRDEFGVIKVRVSVYRRVRKLPRIKNATTRSFRTQPCCICHDQVCVAYSSVVLSCGHEFGLLCIKEWAKQCLSGKNKIATCPVCRSELEIAKN